MINNIDDCTKLEEEITIKQHAYGIEYGWYNPENIDCEHREFYEGLNGEFFLENFIMYTPEKFMEGLFKILDEIKNADNFFYVIIGYVGEEDLEEEDLEELLSNGSCNWFECRFEDGTFAMWKNENGDIVPLLPKKFTGFDTNRTNYKFLSQIKELIENELNESGKKQ